jgi:hypothetical protein
MGPSYAGILGPIAFLAMLIRGVMGGSSANSVLVSSMVSLFAFAAIGYVTGRLADQIVLESVKYRFDRELKAHEKEAGATPRIPTTEAGK